MYEKMWNELKSDIKNMAKAPTFNSRTELKQAEEIARKQCQLHMVDKMEEIEAKYQNQNKDEKYSI